MLMLGSAFASVVTPTIVTIALPDWRARIRKLLPNTSVSEPGINWCRTGEAKVRLK